MKITRAPRWLAVCLSASLLSSACSSMDPAGGAGGGGGVGGAGGAGGTSGGQCGDGALDPGESCDDANTMDGDACPATCLRPVKSMRIDGSHACVLLEDERFKCWGENDFGELGLGDTASRGDGPGEMGDNLPAVDVGTGKTVVAFDSGEVATCALLNHGGVKCWGDASTQAYGDKKTRGDDPGEMGDNLPEVDLGTGKTAVMLGAGEYHTCVILSDGSLRCWGNNSYGKLGTGDTLGAGDDPGEMGDNLPAVDLGTGKTAVTFTAGHDHTCTLLSDGGVKCWGRNDLGQLGQGDAEVRGDNPGEMGDSLPVVDLGTGKIPIALTGGYDHTCALLTDGSIKCWGANGAGQLGLGDTGNRGDDPNEMGDDLPAVDLGRGSTAVAIAAGASHTCALLSDGSIKCWGDNTDGALGLGDTQNRGNGPNEMGDDLPAIDLGANAMATAVDAAGTFTCALLAGGRIKCWGENVFGKLGLGDNRHRGDDPGEMGDNLPFVAP